MEIVLSILNYQWPKAMKEKPIWQHKVILSFFFQDKNNKNVFNITFI